MHNALIRNATMTAVLLAAFCGTTYAGQGNQITIEQNGLGNSLTVDQSGANNSIVDGALLGSDNTLSLSPSAQQLGSGNTAKLTITDSKDADAGRIGLYQNNRTSLANPNDAVVSVEGNGTGLVSQIGGNNTASLLVTGLGSTGSIYQNGDGNTAGDRSTVGLTVEGNGSTGTITQNGNNLNSALRVTGSGTDVSYTLNGNNVTNLPDGVQANAGGVQVISNGATVTITQTRF